MPDSPLRFFELLFTPAMMDKFVAQTNEYAASVHRNRWKDLTRDTLKLFFGIVLYMGLVRLNQREDYWNDPVSKQAFVYEKMSLEQFNNIIACLHYENSAAHTPAQVQLNNQTDPFWNVEPFVKKLAKHCRARYIPKQFIDIDEQGIPFMGRHLCVQYNKDKPDKWHFKVYSLNCADSGYMSNFYLYRGSREVLPPNDTATSYPLLRLTDHSMYKRMNYILVTDNWYTGREALLRLRLRLIHLIGTVRVNRIPGGNALVVAGNSPRGTIAQYRHTDHYYFTSWKDSRVVNFLSAIRSKVHHMQRRTPQGGLLQVATPTIRSIYNVTMGGTDSFDQRMQYYWPEVRADSWKVRVIMHFLYVAIVNSHILYKTYFRLVRAVVGFELIDYIKMLRNEFVYRPPEIPMVVPRLVRNFDQAFNDPNRTVGIHFPIHRPQQCIDEETGKRVDKRRQCAFCRTGRCSYICLQCNVGLHIGTDPATSCFGLFHMPE